MSQLSLETHKEHDGSEDSCGAWLLMDQLALSLGIQMKQRPSRGLWETSSSSHAHFPTLALFL